MIPHFIVDVKRKKQNLKIYLYIFHLKYLKKDDIIKV
jgi:hypothetical protein